MAFPFANVDVNPKT